MLKSKTKVSHAPATVDKVIVSTERVGSFLSSIFNMTGIPASGDHVLTDIMVFSAVIGIAVAKPVAKLFASKAVTVTPADDPAVTGLFT